jgi:hypothetical protein
LAGGVTALFVWRNWVFIDILLLPICFVFGVGFVSYGNHLELKLPVEIPSPVVMEDAISLGALGSLPGYYFKQHILIDLTEENRKNTMCRWTPKSDSS